jgi:hypothetical protein
MKKKQTKPKAQELHLTKEELRAMTRDYKARVSCSRQELDVIESLVEKLNPEKSNGDYYVDDIHVVNEDELSHQRKVKLLVATIRRATKAAEKQHPELRRVVHDALIELCAWSSSRHHPNISCVAEDAVNTVLKLTNFDVWELVTSSEKVERSETGDEPLASSIAATALFRGLALNAEANSDEMMALQWVGRMLVGALGEHG